MKKQLFIVLLCLIGFNHAEAQMLTTSKDTIQVVLENDEVKVTGYVSTPRKDVCGYGKHTHEPHLTIFLTDASITLTTADGMSQDFKIRAGTTLWSDRDTHVAVNSGEKITKLYLVELKSH